MRAVRILATRPDRAIIALAELCEERKDEELVSAPPYVPPRLSHLPPQTPYTVGSSSLRPKGAQPDRLSPPSQFFEPGPRKAIVGQVSTPTPPEHMAARRSKWTSPPPPEAPPADHTLFEDQLGKGLKLATASTGARETEAAGNSSPGNSEVFSDDEHRSDAGESDDVLSVRSFTEGSVSHPTAPFARTMRLHSQESLVRTEPIRPILDPSAKLNPRGRVSGPLSDRLTESISPLRLRPSNDFSRAEGSRSSVSSSPRSANGFDWPLGALITPLPPSPSTPNGRRVVEPITIYYQTPCAKSPLPSLLHSGSPTAVLPRYGTHQVPVQPTAPTLRDTDPSSAHLMNPRASELSAGPSCGLHTPTPASCSRTFHSPSQSTSTIKSSTPLSDSDSQNMVSTPRRRSKSPSPSTIRSDVHGITQTSFSASSPASISNDSDSPTPSSSGYATSLSPCPSPPSNTRTICTMTQEGLVKDIYPLLGSENGPATMPLSPQIVQDTVHTVGNDTASPHMEV
jgi:terminal uridylyltransferase